MIENLNLEELKSCQEDDLLKIFNQVIQKGNEVILPDFFVNTFSIKQNNVSVKQLWEFIYKKVSSNLTHEANEAIQVILEEGCLAQRILTTLSNDDCEDKIREIYHQLSTCLAQNQLFRP